ncbi:MAG: ATP-dependent Clp protease adaptor ClpS [Planctomycetota bacterium]
MSTRNEESSAVATPPKASTKTKPAPPKLDKLPPYKVLLHNDDHNDMLDVVETICTLTPHRREQAIEIMLAAHTRGRALVLVTHKERAELYRDQFKSRKLLVTIEPQSS